MRSDVDHGSDRRPLAEVDFAIVELGIAIPSRSTDVCSCDWLKALLERVVCVRAGTSPPKLIMKSLFCFRGRFALDVEGGGIADRCKRGGGT